MHSTEADQHSLNAIIVHYLCGSPCNLNFATVGKNSELFGICAAVSTGAYESVSYKLHKVRGHLNACHQGVS